MKAQSVEDLGLSEEEMQRMIDGARTAFSHDYGNKYPAGAEAPLEKVALPRPKAKQQRKVKHGR
jgi:hypothetical protein